MLKRLRFFEMLVPLRELSKRNLLVPDLAAGPQQPCVFNHLRLNVEGAPARLESPPPLRRQGACGVHNSPRRIPDVEESRSIRSPRRERDRDPRADRASAFGR